MRLVLVLVLILIPATVYAERWVCVAPDGTIERAMIGDCKRLGLCTGDNNTGLRAGCFEATEAEFMKVRLGNVKGDPTAPVNMRVRFKSQSEIDAENAESQKLEDRRKALIVSLRSKLAAIGLTNEEIDILLRGIR
ncbi:MAG: hypothetical protein KatS3mg087_1620 [Patescibacteria group bacterium]|nr:MAG: hypothetical protein KatS3mg087_1620 [Patescibacteria group bacterium]